eukprot:scaffold238451_cov28-Prasinocladus_malaysianus.AAC.1
MSNAGTYVAMKLGWGKVSEIAGFITATLREIYFFVLQSIDLFDCAHCFRQPRQYEILFLCEVPSSLLTVTLCHADQ